MQPSGVQLVNAVATDGNPIKSALNCSVIMQNPEYSVSNTAI